MYKRKKHREPLHHHRTLAEVAEHERLEASGATAATAATEPTSFLGRLLARLHGVPVVQRAETLLRERVLETPAGHVVRSALGYAAQGRFGRAVGAVRRGVRDRKSARPGAPSETNQHAEAA